MGGCTDYLPFLKEHDGLVIGTTIDKFSYITTRYCPPIFDYKSRLCYSKTETVKFNKDIEHRVIKAAVDYLEIWDGIDINHVSDLPSRTGLGSSSSFLVCLVHALSHLSGRPISKNALYSICVEIEQDTLKENIGLQDTAWATYGGFNEIVFPRGTRNAQIKPVENQEFTEILEKSLLFFYTGIQRTASEVAKVYVEKDQRAEQLAIYDLAIAGREAILKGSIDKFGELLNESWLQKRSISPNISTDFIDNAYDTAMDAGAIGFKLCGAGAGGCVAIIAHPSRHNTIRARLKSLVEIPIKFEKEGVKLIYEI